MFVSSRFVVLIVKFGLAEIFEQLKLFDLMAVFLVPSRLVRLLHVSVDFVLGHGKA